MRRTAFLLLALTALPLAAQTPRDAACERAYEALTATLAARDVAVEGLAVTTCAQLAVVLETAGADARFAAAGAARRAATQAVTPRDVQPLRGASGGGGGSVAQAEAVPSLGIEPFAGGSVSAVGTEAGAGSIATLSLNPLTLVSPLDDERAVAQRARLLDVSVLVPLDDADRNGDGRIDYVGVRVRANAAGLSVGDRAYDAVVDAYSRVFAATLRSAEADLLQIDALLAGAEDPAACAAALLDGEGEGCGGPLTEGAPSLVLYERLDAAAAAVRAAADASYVGLDLRLDYGDPTLGLTPGAYGTSFTGLVAAGRALPGGAATVRGHLGVYYADRESMATARFALDAALGVAFVRAYELQQIAVEAGLSARIGGSDEADPGLEDDVVLLSGSINVPVTAANSASLRVAVPLLGEAAGPVVSLTGNWHLPLPGR